MEKSGGEHFDETGPSTSVSKRTRLSKKDSPAEDAIKEANQEEKMNPLNIPKVVVGHLNDVVDLESLRTQSTVLKDETLLQNWRDSAVLLITVDTFPILVKAFEEADLAHFCEGGNDPFKLKKVPFKKYRFAGNRGDQLWTYPLSETDGEGRLLWDKVITPHATYLDIGECALKKFTGGGWGVTYQPALRWIMKRCPNVTDLAMAPLKSIKEVDTLSDSEEEEENDPDLSLDTLSDSEEEEETEELIKGHDYLFVPGGDLWKLKRFNDPQINSFTLSNTESKKLGGLFSSNTVAHNKPYADFLLGGMMNLKHLHLPMTGVGAEALFSGLTPFGTEKKVHLESLTAFASSKDDSLYWYSLWVYLRTVGPPLRELRSSLYYSSVYENSIIEIPLRHVQTTLEKLELDITIEPVKKSFSLASRLYQSFFKPSTSSSGRIPEVKFSLGDCSLTKLTHFKITVDCYKTPRFLGTFDLNRLMELSALEEFYFGIKNPVDKAWLTRKLQFFEEWSINSAKLDNLKSFHFYGNLTKETLRTLGKMAGNLETLEVVLDAENSTMVKISWPRLKKLSLLKGSGVSDKFLFTLESKCSSECLE